MLGGKDAQPVQHFLIVGRRPQKHAKAFFQIGTRGHFRKDRRIKQTVENMRISRDDFSKPGCGAHDHHEKVQEAGIGLQQAEKLDARRQAFQKAIETQQCLVGTFCLGKSLEQGWRKFGQTLTRFGRLGRAITPEVPCTDHAAYIARTAYPDRPHRR